jgi:hypothetical protein
MTLDADQKLKEKREIVESQIYLKYLNLNEQDWLSYDLEELQNNIKSYASLIFPDQLSEEDLWQIYLNLRAKIDVSVKDAQVLTNHDKKYIDWYNEEFKSSIDHFYWKRFKTYLEKNSAIPRSVITKLNSDSDRIVKKLGDPRGEPFVIKGMVIGSVQAGKTLSYSSVINKAIDAGYILVIVLSGTTESLRSQTQERINSDVIGKTFLENDANGLERYIGVGLIDREKGFATVETSVQNDFNLIRRRSLDLDHQVAPSAIIAKKNVNVLKDINKWLSSSNEKTNAPVLLIDDEADNASVNTAKDHEDPKAINREIRNILQNCNRITYLAYTATPMANIFIKPDEYIEGDYEDLFPSDFLVGLQAPSNYCGGEFFFTNEETSSNAIVEITDNENVLPIKHKKTDPLIEIPGSLIEAIEYFFIAAAIKDLRRKSGEINLKIKDNNFDSCLINVTVYKNRQNDIKPFVQYEVDRIHEALRAYAGVPDTNNESILRLKRLFDEFVIGENIPTWKEVLALLKVIDKPEVLSINGDSPDNLEWNVNNYTKAIIIGGYILSRGLTLPGLTVSYILRSSQAYDTIMQMGRWFGYRDGYRDLVKLWCTPVARMNYSHITDVLSEFNSMIASMERDKLSPRDFGLRIRSHPDLLVTARNRMRGAIEWEELVSFSGTTLQTFVFDKSEQSRIHNQNVSLNFINKIKNYLKADSLIEERHILFDRVSFGDIYDFLNEYKIHKYNNRLGDHDLLMRYLEKHQHGLFSEWDVAIFAKKSGGNVVEEIRKDFKSIFYEERAIYYDESFDKEKYKDYKNSIFLSGNRTIGAARTALVGLEDGQVSTDRTKPILIIHFLEAISSKTRKIPSELKDYVGKKYIALTLIFPNNNDKDDNVTYKVNQKYFDDHFITGNIGGESEEEEV